MVSFMQLDQHNERIGLTDVGAIQQVCYKGGLVYMLRIIPKSFSPARTVLHRFVRFLLHVIA